MPGGTSFSGDNVAGWLSSLDTVRDSTKVATLSALGFDTGFDLYPSVFRWGLTPLLPPLLPHCCLYYLPDLVQLLTSIG